MHAVLSLRHEPIFPVKEASVEGSFFFRLLWVGDLSDMHVHSIYHAANHLQLRGVLRQFLRIQLAPVFPFLVLSDRLDIQTSRRSETVEC